MIGSNSLSLGEGQTPVLPLRSIAKQFGLAEVFAKAEWINPTGSYKDRIAIETIRDALRCSHRGWIGTSSGNGVEISSLINRAIGPQPIGWAQIILGAFVAWWLMPRAIAERRPPPPVGT